VGFPVLPGLRAAVGALAAAGLAGCALVTPPAPATDGIRPPALVEVHGASVPYSGTAPWNRVSAPSPRSRTLTVLAFGQDEDGGGYCGPPLVRLFARETARTVHVLAVRYEVEDTDQPVQCGGLDPRPTPHLLHLASPLGGRTVVDAADGRTHRVVTAAP
jgi:hypothetical protein